MLIGVPKEIKNHEYRIGLTPAGVRELVERGHSVLVEHNGGAAIGLNDDQYQHAGAEIVLFAPDGVFALRWRADDERERYAKLCDAQVLWQLPDDRESLALPDTLRDVDGDGRVDLVVPGPAV